MIPGAHSTWIGIDPASDAVRAVAVRGGAVLAMAEIPVSAPAEAPSTQVFSRLLESLQRQGVPRGAKCVAVPPERSMTSAVLELPPRASGAPIEQLAAAEIGKGLDGGAIEVGAFELPAQQRARTTGTEYLVVGGGRADIVQLITSLGHVGLEIEAVDTPTTAVARAIGTGVRVVAEVGASSLRVHVCEGTQPRFCYISQYTRDSQLDQRVIEELDRCAAYASGRFSDLPLNRVILTGPRARDPQVAAGVRREFDATVVVWSAEYESRGRHGARIEIDPAFAQAFALTSWPLAGGTDRRAAA